MKLKLIENWRLAFRMWSVKLSALGFILTAAEQILPLFAFVTPEVRNLIPRGLLLALQLACFGGAAVARIIRQEKLNAAARARTPA